MNRSSALHFFQILFLVFIPVVYATPLFTENFEKNMLEQWGITSTSSFPPWFLLGKSEGNGSAGATFTSGDDHCLIYNGRWPVGSDLVTSGFYLDMDFKLNGMERRQDEIPVNPFMSLVAFEVAGASGQYFSSPIVTVRRSSQPDKFNIDVFQRPKKGDTPQRLRYREDEYPVDRAAWHHLCLYIAIRNDTLMDSLFIDNRLVGWQRMGWEDSPGLVQALRLGPGWETTLPLSGFSVDNFELTSATDKLYATVPFAQRPLPDEYVFSSVPAFSFAQSSVGAPWKWIEIAVDSQNAVVLDSLFTIPGPYVFSRVLPERVTYGWQARFVDSSGVKLPWSPRTLFHVAGEKMPAFAGEAVQGFQMALRKGARKANGNETLDVELDFVPGTGDMYIDLNLSHARTTVSRADRFGVYVPEENLVISLSGKNALFIKDIPGSNEWTRIVPGVERLPLVAGSYAFDPLGHARISFLLDSRMKPGLWTVSAYLSQDNPATVSHFPVLFFTHEERTHGILGRVTGHHWLFAAFLGIGLLLISALFLFGQRFSQYLTMRKLPPQAWQKIVDDTRVFLTSNLSNREISSAAIAQALGLSEQRLNSIFQKVAGKTPVQELREMRIKRACELLRTTLNSVSDIACEVGFNDPLQFQRNFKKMMGVTPSDFRKNRA